MPLCRVKRSSDLMEISWLNCKQIENCYNFLIHSNFITVKPNLWSYQAKEHLLKFFWSRGSSKNFIIPAGCSLNWKKNLLHPIRYKKISLNQFMLYIRDFSTHQSWLLKFNNNFKALNDILQQSLCRFTRNFLPTRMPSFHNENYDVINKRKCLSLFAPFTIFPLVFFSLSVYKVSFVSS